MSSIGELFSSLRREKSLSIEQVSSTTKIKPHIIICIEKNDFKSIDDYGYTKMYVVTLARFYGADENTVVSLFEQQNSQLKQSFKKVDVPVKRHKFLISTTLIQISFLAIIIIVLGFVLFHFYNQGLLSIDNFKKRFTLLHQQKKVEQTAVVETVNESDSIRVKQQQMMNKKRITTLQTNDNVSIEEAVKDTTDYVNNLLYKNKKQKLNEPSGRL